MGAGGDGQPWSDDLGDLAEWFPVERRAWDEVKVSPAFVAAALRERYATRALPDDHPDLPAYLNVYRRLTTVANRRAQTFARRDWTQTEGPLLTRLMQQCAALSDQVRALDAEVARLRQTDGVDYPIDSPEFAFLSAVYLAADAQAPGTQVGAELVLEAVTLLVCGLPALQESQAPRGADQPGRLRGAHRPRAGRRAPTRPSLPERQRPPRLSDPDGVRGGTRARGYRRLPVPRTSGTRPRATWSCAGRRSRR
jgi:hypothetical protein